MGNVKFVSLADSAFERIEADIENGVYEKGEVLTETKLSEDLGISRTPVREAIRRLEQEHLVTLSTKGVVVCGLSASDVADVYEIRVRLEGLATAKCAALLDGAKLAELKRIVDLQDFYTSQRSADEISGTDSRFHEFIYANCGSAVISDILSSLHKKVRRFRKLSVEDEARAKLAAAEHARIYEALAAHDARLAEKLAARHIRNAEKSILKNLEK